ncbi:MAG: transposase, partial [Iphinoe sp. HA4291-MV1]|nr:transposase [Iphinoe sp. HA4291-MV1]
TIDQAGWHTSNDLDLPEGIDLIYLPAYSPELQPAERLWPLTKGDPKNKIERRLIYRFSQILALRSSQPGGLGHGWIFYYL